MKERILFVDDETRVLEGLRRMLRPQRNRWRMHFAASVDQALALIEELDFDAIITDIAMPQKDGFELLRTLQRNPGTREIPVIILTGNDEEEIRLKALGEGATDLLTKPVDLSELQARVRSALRLKEYRDQLETSADQLEHSIANRTTQLEVSRLDLIWRLAKAGEYRDEETGHHVLRVGYHSRVIAQQMELSEEFIKLILFTAPVHDIGKIGIPDSILLKPGNLTHDEWTQMKLHTVIGAAILGSGSTIREAFCLCGVDLPDLDSDALDNPLLGMASRIALNHHERWDGQGYPNRLEGEQIPLEARITAIADVYDALRSRRPYKEPLGDAEAVAFITRACGSHFDPRVFQAFMASLPQARETLAIFSDPNYEAVVS